MNMKRASTSRPRRASRSLFRGLLESLERRRLLARVAVAPVVAYESQGEARFTATLSEVLAVPTIVSYATVGGTARAGRDFVASRSTVVIPAGENSATFAIPLVPNDVSAQPDRRFVIRLEVEGGASIARLARAVIVDDAPPPSIRPGDAVVGETGGSGRARGWATVELSNPSARPVVFRYSTADGTATSSGPGKDYLPARGLVRFRPGQTTARIPLTIINRQDADDKVFAIEYAARSGANAPAPGGPTRVVARHDSEEFYRGSITVQDASATAGDSVVFRVTVGFPNREVSVRYWTEPDTASTSDFNPVSGILTVPAGIAEGIIAVPTSANADLTGARRFRLHLSGPANANLITPQAFGTIDYSREVVLFDSLARPTAGAEPAPYGKHLAAKFTTGDSPGLLVQFAPATNIFAPDDAWITINADAGGRPGAILAGGFASQPFFLPALAPRPYATSLQLEPHTSYWLVYRPQRRPDLVWAWTEDLTGEGPGPVAAASEDFGATWSFYEGRAFQYRLLLDPDA